MSEKTLPDIDIDFTYIPNFSYAIRVGDIATDKVGRFIKVYIPEKLENYPWIKSADHLRRINKYRKRTGQPIIRFTEDDMFELIMLRNN